MKIFLRVLKVVVFLALAYIKLEEITIGNLFPTLRPKLQATIDFYWESIISWLLFIIVVNFLQILVIYLYRRRKKVLVGDDNFIIGIGHIYSIVFVSAVAFGILSLFRINIKEVFTSLSIIFAGLAILTKDYIGSMISGMIITFSGNLSIGDHVKIGKNRGKIVDITLQEIHLLNEDDDYIYIPNNVVYLTEVINYTKRHIKKTSIEFEIGLKHINTIEELEQEIIETLKPFAGKIRPQSYYLRVADIMKDKVALKFQYILNEPDKELERLIRRTAIRRVVELITNREKEVDK